MPSKFDKKTAIILIILLIAIPISVFSALQRQEIITQAETQNFSDDFEIDLSHNYQVFATTVPSYQPNQEVAVVFPNDYYGGSKTKDRNLWVDYININGRIVEIENANQVIYDRGLGEAAFDNQDIVNAYDRQRVGWENMAWNGALRTK